MIIQYHICMIARNRRYLTYVSFTLAVILLGTFLQPRLLNQLVPWAQSYKVDSFFKESIREQSVSREKLWEFRDKNNIGNFTQDPKILLAHPLLQRVTVKDFIPQLAYNSESVQSLGGQTALSELPITTSIPKSALLIMTSSVKLFASGSNEYILLTLTPLQEEKKINGFIQKIKLVDNKNYWLEISKIKK